MKAGGVRLHGYSTLYSDSPVKALAAGDPACSFEIWLRPEHKRSQTIFSVYTPEAPQKFTLRQSNADLVLRTKPGYGTPAFEVDGIFAAGQPLHIAGTSGAHGTAVYVNGQLARSAPDARYSMKDLEGTWILSGFGNRHDAWNGEIRALAIYNRELTPAEVSHDYERWTKHGPPGTSSGERALAMYSFEEGTGRTVRNRVPEGTPLTIPERFTVLHQVILEYPWTEFRPDWPYWKDVILNLGGFIPLGFFLRAYLPAAGNRTWPALATILLGAAASLTVEALQSYLPTRDSSMTDVLTNTLGTCMGAWLSAAVYS